jgi:small-conductance mechanosensitive channel
MEGVLLDPAPFMIVEKLGDYNVLVRFFGWIDQRKADFAKVRGEAIRRIKLALDEAGIEMPEPIQTIRVQRLRAAPSETTATAESQAQIAAERETETMDVSPDTQLDDQIRDDLAATHESNLLVEG